MRVRDFFERVYVINMASRPDRLREVTNELARFGMPFEPGRVERLDAVVASDAGGFPDPGTRGCYLSHLQALRQARTLGLRSVLVLEDDVMFTPWFYEYQEEVTAQLASKEWGLAFLGHDLETPNPDRPRLAPLTRDRTQCHCYAVQGPTIDVLFNFLESFLDRPRGHPDGFPMPVDGAMNRFRWSHPEVTILYSQPTLAIQRSSRTDLHRLKFFDRLPLVRDGVALLRRVRNRLRWVGRERWRRE